MNNFQKKRLVIVGAGSAGLMAAVAALEYLNESAENPLEVLVLEKMPRAGRKLRISGKGRGNLTNAAEIKDFINYYPGNGRFLYSALSSFTNEETRAFFASQSVETKIERGGRIFPVSDKASDLVDALVNAIAKKGGKIRVNTTAAEILTEDNGITKKINGVRLKNGKTITADAVIIATGGLSYPLTGSTGDGYRFAKNLGHRVTRLFPALVPLKCLETKDLSALQGLTLKNAETTLFINGKKVGCEFGELAALDGYLAGAAVLKLSRLVSESVAKKGEIDAKISVDLKPALDEAKLSARIERDIANKEKLTTENLLRGLLPFPLAAVIAQRLKLDLKSAAKQLTQKTRLALARILKNLLLR